uniref:Uncharacterized protein n=2 Tax=Ixodes scapularis TaxID=6945 RepID=A0A1S4KT39_IXOSC
PTNASSQRRLDTTQTPRDPVLSLLEKPQFLAPKEEGAGAKRKGTPRTVLRRTLGARTE